MGLALLDPSYALNETFGSGCVLCFVTRPSIGRRQHRSHDKNRELGDLDWSSKQ
jgi:hypothetical protein